MKLCGSMYEESTSSILGNLIAIGSNEKVRSDETSQRMYKAVRCNQRPPSTAGLQSDISSITESACSHIMRRTKQIFLNPLATNVIYIYIWSS